MAGQYPTEDRVHTILGVVPRFADTRNGQKQVFDIQCDGGKQYTAWNPQAAGKAQNAVGQGPVIVRVSLNGQYENFQDIVAAAAPGTPSYGGGFQASAPQFTPAPGSPGPPVQTQQFTPAPGFVDAKQAEMRRVGGIQNASAALGTFIATHEGYLGEDGTLNVGAVAADIIALGRLLTKFTVEGPQSAQSEPVATAEQAPVLPPGVTPEQVAAWANANAQGAVEVGAPVEAEQTEAY